MQQVEQIAQVRSDWYIQAMEQLVSVVQDLSTAHDLAAITEIVRNAARELTGADGATFVLKDGPYCFYVDESAIAPLWKGKRFPLETCISGWVMQHRKSVMIEDIYQDARVPHNAYRPTFVKSLAMVPIRSSNPIGAIGNYWATHHQPTEEEMDILQALADTTSVAIANAQLYEELENKVSALQESNYALNRFAWVASHDLQEPLRTIALQIELLADRYSKNLDARAKEYMGSAMDGARRMQDLIESLLVHSRAEKVEDFKPVDMEKTLSGVIQDMQALVHEHDVKIRHSPLPVVMGEAALLARVLQNLIGNAVKYHQKNQPPQVDIKAEPRKGEWLFSVSDNGIGIDAKDHQRIFGFFERVHSYDIQKGSGIGLATSKKIIELHGGSIWLESALGQGSTFYFTLPDGQGG